MGPWLPIVANALCASISFANMEIRFFEVVWHGGLTPSGSDPLAVPDGEKLLLVVVEGSEYIVYNMIQC